MNVEDRLIEHANTAHRAIRAINHLTFAGPSIPAPTLYPMLNELSEASYGIAQALNQLGQALERSLGTHDVYEVDGGDPRETVFSARLDLDEAVVHANRLGQLLQAAQTTIAGQGYEDADIIDEAAE